MKYCSNALSQINCASSGQNILLLGIRKMGTIFRRGKFLMRRVWRRPVLDLMVEVLEVSEATLQWKSMVILQDGVKLGNLNPG